MSTEVGYRSFSKFLPEKFRVYGNGCVVCSVGKHQANGSGDKHTLYVHVQINIALVILLGLDIGGATLYGDTT